ncbi:MAG: hypothetical protein K6F32_03305 [Bacilli bacterium]|nr:hypothetical protein [Bacilli bacterium]
MIEVKPCSKGSLFRLSNESGTALTLASYGAGARRFECFGRDMLVAPMDDDDYFDEGFLFGKCVGPFLGRIDKGEICGYDLGVDMDGYSLHSGKLSFAFREWKAIPGEDGNSIRFILDAEEVPGRMPAIHVEVEYRLEDYGYTAKATAIPAKPYPLNIAFHPYFNLGYGPEGILEHTLCFKADKVSRYDPRMVPIGEKEVTPVLDFSSPKPIGRDILNEEIAIPPFGGYDHCYLGVHWPVVLEGHGFRLTLEANRDCLQVYSLNVEEVGTKLFHELPISLHVGIALEAVNNPIKIKDTLYDAGNPYVTEERITIERK